MKTISENIDDNRLKVTFELEPEDYMQQVDKELRKIQKEREFKGFRKGKTPLSFLRKTYGLQLLSGKINDILNQAIDDYLKENDLNPLTAPVILEAIDLNGFNFNKPQTLTFSIEIFDTPKIEELKGLSKDYEYTHYDIEANQDIVDAEIKRIKYSFGHYEEYDGDEINEELFVTIIARELDGDKIKETPFENEFSVKISDISGEYRNLIMASQKGDEVDFDIFKFLKDKNKVEAIEYILNINKEDYDDFDDLDLNNMFRGEIVKFEIFKEGELNEENVKKIKIKDVNTEEDLRQYLTDLVKKNYDSLSEELLFHQIFYNILELNDFDIPEDYVIHYHNTIHRDRDISNNPKKIQKYKLKLKNQIIFDYFNKKYEIPITHEEIRNAVMQEAYLTLPNANESLIQEYTKAMLENEGLYNQFFEKVYLNKLKKKLIKDVTLKEEPIKFEEFRKINNEFIKKFKDKYGLLTEDEEE